MNGLIVPEALQCKVGRSHEADMGEALPFDNPSAIFRAARK
jgi:hypothetical protein